MQVILLAAGKSTRLDPISDKNLLEFIGKPLIQHQVEALKKAGLKQVTIVGNKDNLPAIRALFKDEKNVRITEQKALAKGMAGGVLAGAAKMKEKQVLIMSTNDIFGPELFKKIKKAAKKNVDGVIAGKTVSEYFPGGYLKLNKKGQITDIIEKPGPGKEPSDLVNLVCHFYRNFPAFSALLSKSKSKKDDVYEVALDAYIKKGAKIEVIRHDGFWQAIKYPWHILAVMNHFLENQKRRVHRSAQIAKTATIRGNVVIEKEVKVLDHAVIQGPAYIGEGSVVANNALVRGSMVGRRCVVGYTTEIARSYLNYDIWTHSNYVGDSLIDHNVSFGAGGVTGNLRFDEKNVKVNIQGKRIDSGTPKLGAIIGSGTRFGINASINPGVKIGRNCFVGGGVILEKDLADNLMILAKQSTTVLKNNTEIHMENRKK